jgi:hypothetical protein
MFTKSLSICLAVIVVFLSSLQGGNQVNLDDPHVIKQQMEDGMVLLSFVDSWKNVGEKYFQKNGADQKIKCKTCAERFLSIGEFEGCLVAWAIKAIAAGHNEFEKIKTFMEEYVRVLSADASAEELTTFMLKTSNDMKEVCMGCHGIVWERIA